MPTRNIVLTEQQSDFVDGLVAQGRFQNASEVLRAGLRLLQDDEDRRAAMIARISEGWAQAQRGEFVEGTFEEIVERAFRGARSRAAS